MIDYPTNLPQPTDSLTGESVTPVIRTDQDTGLLVQEGRFATGRDTYDLSWKLSQEEVVIFEEWFNETLSGGQLLFALTMTVDGGLEEVPARFIGGNYRINHDGALWFNVGASVEVMFVSSAAPNRTPSVPPWFRLELDEALSQTLGTGFRNALLITRPTEGNITTFRVPPPTDETQWIYFGVQNFGAGEVLITSEDTDPLPTYSPPNFPGTLPAVNIAFSEAANRGAERLEMDGGHPRQWSRFETTTRKYSASWDFDLDQLQEFRDFFFTTLQGGARHFFLQLPVDGQFFEVPVRFIGGKFEESYVPHNRFKVTGQLERVVAQTVLPSELRPYPLYHAPAVTVTANRKVLSGDAFKMFNVFPDEGQTINLHIYDGEFEFGVTVKGLGNVLITRGPFVVDLGSIGSDSAGALSVAPTLELRDSILVIGSIGEDVSGVAHETPILSLISAIENIGSIATEVNGVVSKTPDLQLLDVLLDIGSIGTDTIGTTSNTPTLILDIP